MRRLLPLLVAALALAGAAAAQEPVTSEPPRQAEPAPSPPPALVISLARSTLVVTPPGDVVIEARVTNPGGSGATVRVVASDVMDRLDLATMEGPIHVAPGGEATFRVRVAAPAGTPPGRYSVLLTARAAEDARRDAFEKADIEVLGTRRPLLPALAIEQLPQAPLLLPGTTVAKDLVVTNMEGHAARVALRALVVDARYDGATPERDGLDPGTRARFTVTLDPDVLDLPPGGTATVRVTMTLAEDAPRDMEHRVFARLYAATRYDGERAASILFAEMDYLTPIGYTQTARPVAAALDVAREHPVATAGVAVASVGALGAAVASRRDAWRYAAMAPLLPLYSRLAKSEVLDNALRERIYQAIVATPGVDYSTLKRTLAVNAGALVHHLRQLERHQLVRSQREGAHRRFYAAAARLPEPPRADLTDKQRDILAALGDDGLTTRALAERFGLSQQGLSYHVKTLERKGLVERRLANGEWRCYRAAPAATAPGRP